MVRGITIEERQRARGWKGRFRTRHVRGDVAEEIQLAEDSKCRAGACSADVGMGGMRHDFDFR